MEIKVSPVGLSDRPPFYPRLLRNTTYTDLIVLALGPAAKEGRFKGVVLQNDRHSTFRLGEFHEDIGYYAFVPADDVELTIKN